jgi:hypothetical protein
MFDRPYSCEFCAMTFIGPTNLSQHRKRSHGDVIGESPKVFSSFLCKVDSIDYRYQFETV